MRSGLLSPLTALILLLTACAPIPTPIPQPSPHPLVVVLDPLLEPIRPLLAACLPASYGLYETEPAVPADARLDWGDPSTATASPFRFILGSEQIAWIVNPANPAASLTLDQLRQIYAGGANPPASGLVAWSYPPENAARILLTRVVGWQILLPSSVHIAANPAQMLKSVAADPGAIGYIPLRWVDASVRTLTITGMDAASLSQPILASTTSSPDGAIKDWLLCIQEKLGKK